MARQHAAEYISSGTVEDRLRNHKVATTARISDLRVLTVGRKMHTVVAFQV